MNIWIFNHYAVDPNSSGGTRHYDLAYELTKRGHKVTIIASSFNHFMKKEKIRYGKGTFVAKESINGVNYLWIKTKKYNGSVKRIVNILDYSWKAYKASKKEINTNKPDIIIGSTVHPLASYIGYLVSKKYKIIYYFEERDLWPQTFVDFGKISSNNLVTKVLYKFEKMLYDKAKRVIVLFAKAPDYVISKGVDKSKVIYLPNGVNLNNYQDIQADSKISEVTQQYKYKVVYTGSHGTANNLDPLIETANILQNKLGNKDIQFILVGNGLLKGKLIEQAKSYNLKNVTFLDSIPKNKIPFLLSQADLSFVSLKESPLYKWGFSMNKLFDYMASGLPIMMYASKEIAGDFKDIFGVDLSQSSDELANNILLRINDETYKKKVNHSLKEYVRNNYSWKKLAFDLESYMERDIK
ncbi:glycosyltransferase family 4 protein [Oceanobacillus picturae]|uniref:glycosyltransferase family 4 protein n=1 Tax=Oceanobacillus picturae TaxID=171693 RepID=UPI000E677EDF|nr:glycosyltransferase family 4 protein [Oceanobacillus picturae]RIU94750.1 glycosyltransferase WbuB [Oceanobacillus picturae]